MSNGKSRSEFISLLGNHIWSLLKLSSHLANLEGLFIETSKVWPRLFTSQITHIKFWHYPIMGAWNYILKFVQIFNETPKVLYFRLNFTLLAFLSFYYSLATSKLKFVQISMFCGTPSYFKYLPNILATTMCPMHPPISMTHRNTQSGHPIQLSGIKILSWTNIDSTYV